MAKEGFWKRLGAKTPGSLFVVTHSSGKSKTLTFNEFEKQMNDAWGEGNDDREFMSRSLHTSQPTPIPSKPAVTKQVTPAPQDDKRTPSLPHTQFLDKISPSNSSPPPLPSTPVHSHSSTHLTPISPHDLNNPPETPSSSSSNNINNNYSSENSLNINSNNNQNNLDSHMNAGYNSRSSNGNISVNLNNGLGGSNPGSTPSTVPSSPSVSRAGFPHLTPIPQHRKDSEQLPKTKAELRLEKFTSLITSPNLDLDELRELSWGGIPDGVRATTWGLLSGYIPANIERRASTLQRKRAEYVSFISQYFDNCEDEPTLDQIHKDILRTHGGIPTFQQPQVQHILERILYIWAIRHPGSGYVQGINDLVTPFFVVFLAPHTKYDILDCDIKTISSEALSEIEADSFWCVSKLLDGIQDNYTFATPGIQMKVRALQEFMKRIDMPLHQHITTLNVEYLQFAFRWMNCLLMRELPLKCVIRLWDTYHAEVDGFASFHVFVCASFLATFSEHLRSECPDFHTLLETLQHLDTAAWSNQQIEMLLAQAYRWKHTFQDVHRYASSNP